LRTEVTTDAATHLTGIHISGEIDVVTAPQLRQLVLDLIADGRADIVIDLEDVEFIDSVGLGMLVGALKRAREAGGDLRMVSPRPRVLRVLDITGLTDVFAVPGDVPHQ